MVDSVNVIGRGRVGSALAARLRERGVELRDDEAELVLLCVPDRGDRGRRRGDRAAAPGSRTSAGRRRSPRSTRTSGGSRSTRSRPSRATRPRAARRRLGRRHRGDRTRRGRAAASSRATLGLRPFDLDDDARTLYHAGAAIASNYLVTLYRAAAGCSRTRARRPRRSSR